jgi:anti-sigma factor RsiW
MSNQSVEALSCQELVELVTAYLERALPAEQSSRFEQHIAGCDGCDVYVEQMRTTIRLAGKLTPEAVPPEAERALLSAFRSWAGT